MKMFFTENNKNFNKGFSIIEMIVAVAIVIFAILGPMAVAKKSLALAKYSKDQIVAYYLAEEAIEYVRYMTDKDILDKSEKNDWLASLNLCANAGGSDLKGCALDIKNSPQAQTCSNIDDHRCKLYQENSSGAVPYPFYTHKNTGSNTATYFSRIVRVKEILTSSSRNVGQEERLIEVEVVWKAGNLPKRSITLRGFLLNWKEQPADKFNKY